MTPPSYYALSPQTYNDQFWWKKDDIEFWKQIFLNPNSTILELAAGTGRLALPLIREKLQYKGLELSREYCNFANKQLDNISDKKHIIQGDMRTFSFNKTFDNIFVGFNSLLHLLNEKDLIKTLNCIKSHMHKKSKLYIDIFVPHTLFISRSENKKMKICEFFDSIIMQESTIYEELSYNDKNEIMHVTWFYESEGRGYNQFTFNMKMYYPDTMNRILAEQNFKILNLWGDYNQSSFNEESNLQIYQCMLNNEQ